MAAWRMSGADGSVNGGTWVGIDGNTQAGIGVDVGTVVLMK